jgi:hypothetical protein
MAKHLPKKHSLHISWVLAAMAFFVGGMIIQAYLSTVLELEQRNSGTVLGTAVGTSASVPANPDNTLAQQLSEKEMRLDQREADLALQELTIANQIQKERNRLLAYLLIGALVILGLVAYNFYLDYQYRHEHANKKKKKYWQGRQRA